MKNKAKVVRVKNAEGNIFRVYALVQGEERHIGSYMFKEEIDPDDKYWGENTAREQALEFARKWEQLGNGKEEVIYQTPE